MAVGNKFEGRIGGIVLAVLSAAFLVGTLTVFGACGPKEDGAWMTCHWANVAVSGIAAVLLVASVAHAALGDAKVKMGIDIALIPAAVLAAITPGILIDLCMMDTMQCQAVMHPAVIAFGALIAVVAAVDLFAQRSRAR